MGYTTDFYGRFELNKPLDEGMFVFLDQFNNSRRVKWKDLDPAYGTDGEFYTEGGMNPDHDDKRIVDYNRPPSSQPGLWCQWRPSDDAKGIEWDGNEKFYHYEEWLVYLIHKILIPNGYVLNGEVSFQGEDNDDSGRLIVEDNVVYISHDIKSEGPKMIVECSIADQTLFIMEQKLLS